MRYHRKKIRILANWSTKGSNKTCVTAALFADHWPHLFSDFFGLVTFELFAQPPIRVLNGWREQVLCRSTGTSKRRLGLDFWRERWSTIRSNCWEMKKLFWWTASRNVHCFASWHVWSYQRTSLSNCLIGKRTKWLCHYAFVLFSMNCAFLNGYHTCSIKTLEAFGSETLESEVLLCDKQNAEIETRHIMDFPPTSHHKKKARPQYLIREKRPRRVSPFLYRKKKTAPREERKVQAVQYGRVPRANWRDVLCFYKISMTMRSSPAVCVSYVRVQAWRVPRSVTPAASKLPHETLLTRNRDTCFLANILNHQRAKHINGRDDANARSLCTTTERLLTRSINVTKL